MVRSLLLSALLMTALLLRAGEPERADVVVYGATPGGIAAALAAAKSGCGVVLIDPTRHVGGLTTNGLTHTDFRTFEAITGTFLQLTQRAQAYYEQKYGKDSEQAKLSFRGTQCEPHVYQLIFDQMLAEQPKIKVVLQRTLASLERGADGKSIASTSFTGPDGAALKVAGKCFIDGSYEGDLMAMAGEKWRVGREGRDEYGESLAPEQGDNQLQAYNFRMSMTNRADNRTVITPPPGYDRKEFVDVIPLLKDGRVKRVFCHPSGGMFKAQIPVLPNGKYDINDVSHEIVRLSMPGENLEWPTGDAAARKRIYDRHKRYNLGLLYFLQTDADVPEKFQAEAKEWGLSKDEFTDNGNFPEQLYVREARRMVGQHVYTERDTECAGDDWRTILFKDAIAMGDYSHNCHGTSHTGPFYGGKHVGEFYKNTAPYQIPLGVIVPKETPNLLVPVAISSSHVGFCALRLEPIWSAMGQAAGFAAAQSVQSNSPVQKLNVDAIQRALHADGLATVYVSDVPPSHADFKAVQWWSSIGGLHGLSKREGKPGVRGKNIAGQYFEAFPGHKAELDAPLSVELKEKWVALAKSAGVNDDSLRDAATRGAFIRKAYEAKK